MRCLCHKKNGRQRDARPGGGLGLKKHTRRPALRTVLFGMLLGLGLGLLFAPKPGPETISSLAGKKRRLMEKLIRKLPV